MYKKKTPKQKWKPTRPSLYSTLSNEESNISNVVPLFNVNCLENCVLSVCKPDK